jgi:hypothetical protein
MMRLQRDRKGESGNGGREFLRDFEMKQKSYGLLIG